MRLFLAVITRQYCDPYNNEKSALCSAQFRSHRAKCITLCMSLEQKKINQTKNKPHFVNFFQISHYKYIYVNVCLSEILVIAASY